MGRIDNATKFPNIYGATYYEGIIAQLEEEIRHLGGKVDHLSATEDEFHGLMVKHKELEISRSRLLQRSNQREEQVEVLVKRYRALKVTNEKLQEKLEESGSKNLLLEEHNKAAFLQLRLTGEGLCRSRDEAAGCQRQIRGLCKQNVSLVKRTKAIVQQRSHSLVTLTNRLSTLR